MNLYYMILIRTLIVGIYLGGLIKLANFKQHDKSVKLRFDPVSLIVVGLITLINVSLFVIPAAKMPIIYGFIVGNAMMVLTYFHLRQMMLFGDKIMVFKGSAFMIKDISNFKSEKGSISLRIKNNPLTFRRPLGDLKFAEEKFSGRRPKKR